MVPPPFPLNELKIPGQPVCAWLEIDGRKAEIYATNVEGNVVSGWVASRAGAEVKLGYRLGMEKVLYDVVARGYADGSAFHGHILESSNACFSSAANSASRELTMSGTAISGSAERKLEFTPIAFTENRNIALNNQAILDGLGAITLKVNYGTAGFPINPPVFFAGPVDQSPIYRGSLIELDVDLTERVKLGRTVLNQFSQREFDDMDGRGALVGEFKFYYRSREMLERRGIIKVGDADLGSSSEYEPDSSRSVTPLTVATKKVAVRSALVDKIELKRKTLLYNAIELSKLKQSQSKKLSHSGSRGSSKSSVYPDRKIRRSERLAAK